MQSAALLFYVRQRKPFFWEGKVTWKAGRGGLVAFYIKKKPYKACIVFPTVSGNGQHGLWLTLCSMKLHLCFYDGKPGNGTGGGNGGGIVSPHRTHVNDAGTDPVKAANAKPSWHGFTADIARKARFPQAGRNPFAKDIVAAIQSA